MTLVDSAVWIDWINLRTTPQTRILERVVREQPVVMGDLVLCEVLMGLRDDRAARRVESLLRPFRVVAIGSDELARAAAANDRRLRSLGITIRSTIDVLIGTWCIVHDASLLHRDRDFEPLARHLGLRAIAA